MNCWKANKGEKGKERKGSQRWPRKMWNYGWAPSSKGHCQWEWRTLFLLFIMPKYMKMKKYNKHQYVEWDPTNIQTINLCISWQFNNGSGAKGMCGCFKAMNLCHSFVVTLPHHSFPFPVVLKLSWTRTALIFILRYKIMVDKWTNIREFEGSSTPSGFSNCLGLVHRAICHYFCSFLLAIWW